MIVFRWELTSLLERASLSLLPIIRVEASIPVLEIPRVQVMNL